MQNIVVNYKQMKKEQIKQSGSKEVTASTEETIAPTIAPTIAQTIALSVNETNENCNKKYPFKGIVFEGGGPLGSGHVGVLEVLQEKNILSQLDYFVGSSAGAIAAALMACRCDIDYMNKALMKLDFKMFLDDSPGFIRDIFRFFTKYGWCKGDQLEKWYGGLLKDVTGNSDITLKEVYEKYGTTLIITCTHINTGRTLYLSYLNEPNLMVKKIVRRSCLIPGAFKPDTETKLTDIIQNGVTKQIKIKHYYADGGLLDNYPIRYLSELLGNEKVIGVKIMSSLELSELENPYLGKITDSTNLVKYLSTIICMYKDRATKDHVHDIDWQRTIKLDVGTISSMKFDMTNDDKLFLINQGRLAAGNFFRE